MSENDRIRQCRESIINALNAARIPLAVSALILENVQMQVQMELCKENARGQTPQKEEKTDGEPNQT